MRKKFIEWINFGMLALFALTCLGTFAFFIVRPSEILPMEVKSEKESLPQNAFAMNPEDYEAIGDPFVHLHFVAPTLQLPDLRALLVYCGKNGRPDAQLDKPVLHFSFNGLKQIVSTYAGQPLYLAYDKNAIQKYSFSLQNRETPLWIEAAIQGNEALISLKMKNENGDVISTPTTFGHFKLPEKEYVRLAGSSWEIGKWKVDPTLLSRQKAKWYGKDLFLEKHGGDEYQHLRERQRIDFGEKESTYSVYVKVGDSLIWEGEKWVVLEPGHKSLGLPLMIVKKIDERLLSLELWDVDGKGKIPLNLLRSVDHVPTQQLIQDFKFVGARTKSQFVFEVKEERILLKPQDWILLTEDGWKKLATVEDIDAFVDRKLIGTLFVLHDVKDDKLNGTLFNPTRTDAQLVELVMQTGATPQLCPSPKGVMITPESSTHPLAFEKN